MTVELILCETCRLPETPADDPAPRPGAVLTDLVRAAFAAEPELAGVEVRGFRCMMNCKRPCTAHVRGPGRMGYVLGDLPADESGAETLTAYLRAYVQTTDGVVPFRQWPAGVKGRFIAKIPPLPPGPSEPAGG